MNIKQYKNPLPHNKFDRIESEFIGNCLNKTPWQFHRHIENRFSWQLKNNGLRSANLELLKISKRLESARIDLAMSDDEICKEAEKQAIRTGRFIAKDGMIAGQVYVNRQGIKLPKCDTDAGMVARITEEQWWRGRLRKKHARAIEKEAITLNMVHAKKEIYSSNASVSRRKSQKTRNRRILEEVYAVNEQGQAYLTKKWELIRSELQRRKINVYGIRVCEPHHDGCPHWHLLFFMRPGHVVKAREIVKRYMLGMVKPHFKYSKYKGWYVRHKTGVCSLLGDYIEKGARKYRVDFKKIDWTKKSKKTGRCWTAAGYIAKYISKNIDAYGIEHDLYGKGANKSIERVDAWASTWGIRQFQPVGGHSVTVWRELRRLKAEDVAGTVIEKHWQAADMGDWFAYMMQMDKQPIGLYKEYNENPGKYLEPLGDQIKGVCVGGVEFITRKHEWSIKNANNRNTLELYGSGGLDELRGSFRVFGSRGIFLDEDKKHEWSIKNGKERQAVESDSILSGGRVQSSGRNGNGICIRSETHKSGSCTESGSFNLLSGVFSPPWSSVNNCTVNHETWDFTAHVRHFYLHKYWFNYYRSLKKWKLLEKNKKSLISRSIC